MAETVVDTVSVSQAIAALELSRATFYRRCKKIGIEPVRDGVQASITMGEFKQLEAFQEQRGELSARGASLQRESVQLVRREADAIELVQAIAQLLPQPVPDVFAPQRALQEAAEKGWLLSTEQLAQVLTIAPRTVRRGGDRLGFQFERVGREWRILLHRKSR